MFMYKKKITYIIILSIISAKSSSVFVDYLSKYMYLGIILYICSLAKYKCVLLYTCIYVIYLCICIYVFYPINNIFLIISANLYFHQQRV